MKKIIASIFFNFLAVGGFAQVGVGTISPEKELHIASQNGTIRIDGLNAINQNNTPGNKGVYVNNEGTFVATDEVKIIHEFKANGSNINPYFTKDTMYVKTTQPLTTKKLGTDLNFTNSSNGILMISFQPKVSLIGNSPEVLSNNSPRNLGVKLVIKDVNNQVVHHVTKHTLLGRTSVFESVDETCLDNLPEDATDEEISACIQENYKGLDLNLNLSTSTFLAPGDYKIEVYGLGFRSNDISGSASGNTISPDVVTYTITYDHDLHSEMNVYIIHP